MGKICDYEGPGGDGEVDLLGCYRVEVHSVRADLFLAGWACYRLQ